MRNVVATVGLHGSASTWVFNVARELMIAAHGQEQVLAVGAEKVEHIPEIGGRSLILKSHQGSAALDAWLTRAGALMLLSVRDPRDAAISMAQRFNAPLAAAVGWLMNDCAHLRELVAAGHPLFRYEDRFFEDKGAALRVAALLEVDLDENVVGGVSARYETAAIRRFIQAFDKLPPERFVNSGVTVFDSVTQIHRTHIGDTRIGKWRALPEADRAAITKRFAVFLEAFGYPS